LDRIISLACTFCAGTREASLDKVEPTLRKHFSAPFFLWYGYSVDGYQIEDHPRKEKATPAELFKSHQLLAISH